LVRKTGRKSSYASDVITWTEEDRLTQLAGVARTADVFTLADHTFRLCEIIQAFLPDGSVSRQGRISATTSLLLVVMLGWTALGATGFLVSLTWQNSKRFSWYARIFKY
jgi:hypothetical protein